MTKLYDDEDLLKSIRKFFRDNLNDEIDKINTRKNDWKIDRIQEDDKHYVFSSEIKEIPNHIYVNIGIEGDIQTENNHGNLKSTISLIVQVIFDDPMDNNKSTWMGMRYMTAIFETMLKYDAPEIGSGALQITKVVPMQATTQNRHLIVSGIGVDITFG